VSPGPVPGSPTTYGELREPVPRGSDRFPGTGRVLVGNRSETACRAACRSSGRTAHPATPPRNGSQRSDLHGNRSGTGRQPAQRGPSRTPRVTERHGSPTPRPGRPRVHGTPPSRRLELDATRRARPGATRRTSPAPLPHTRPAWPASPHPGPGIHARSASPARCPPLDNPTARRAVEFRGCVTSAERVTCGDALAGREREGFFIAGSGFEGALQRTGPASLGECGPGPRQRRGPRLARRRTARPSCRGMPVNARGKGADVPSMILSSDRMVSGSTSMIASGPNFTLSP